IDAALGLIDPEGLRARPGRDAADDLELGDVEDVDHIVVPAGDIELGAVEAEMHVARPARGFDVFDDLVGLGIDHDKVVRLLIADEDQPSVLGTSRRDCEKSDEGGGRDGKAERAAIDQHGFPLRLRITSVAASVRPIKAVGQADRRMAQRRDCSVSTRGRQGPIPVNDVKDPPALLLDQVVKSYGPVKALAGVSLTAKAGEVIPLLGPNRAGKSTLCQLLSGLFLPDSGRIEVMGHDMKRDPVPALAGLGIVFQQPTLDLELTVTANLLFHTGLHGMPRAEAKERIAADLTRLA